MTYEELLAKAPAHDSPAFIDFLRDNNTVVFENDQWIIVENVKYHTAERHWFTAFWKSPCTIGCCDWYDDIDILWYQSEWSDMAWLKKAANKQTVNRFHIHIYDESDG